MRSSIRIAAVVAIVALVGPLAAGGSRAQDGAIRDIVVEGVQRTDAGTVRSYLLVQPGDPFDEARIDRSLKSLYATGLFADVSITRDGDRLLVRVIENPIVNRVQFEGNRKIEDKTLDAETTLKPRSIYTRAKAQADVNRILSVYRRTGRFAATVEAKIIELPQNRVDVVFEIEEGPVTSIENVRFVGNEAFSDSELRSVIRTKESAWWRLLSTEDTFDPDRISVDRELLRRFYLENGYLDFRIVSSAAELAEDRKSFYVLFTVEEGERYKVQSVDVRTTLKGLDTEEIRDQITLSAGDWYDSTAVEKSVERLSEAVGTLGYAFVEIRPRVDRRENHQVAIVFDINEGPRVFVERIDISGNVRTMDKVIRREFRLVEGDAFSSAKVRRSRERLQNLDFFSKVNVEQTPGSAPDRAVIKTTVEEKSTGSLSVGAGFSTGAGVLGDISVRERNFLGRGQDLQATLLIGQLQQQVSLSFTEPYFLNRDVTAGFDVFFVQTDRQDQSSFNTRTLGADMRANYPLTEHLRQGWEYTLKQSEILDVPSDASLYVKDEEGSELISELGHSLTYDRTNSRIDPSSGYLMSLSTDLAGLGGTVAYLRNRAQAAYYVPVTDSVTFQLSGSGGYIFGLGEDTRLLNRFFIGGNEIRGFKVDGVGPRDETTGDAIGAQLFYAGTLQLTFPLGLPQEFGIKGRVFNDFGSAWMVDQPKPRDVRNPNRTPNLEDSSNIRDSVGVGVTWVSPFGPLGVDIGYALLKEEFDDTELLRINFGTRF